MDEQAFIVKYWFPATQIITVVNPRDEDYKFTMVVDTGLNALTGKPGTESRKYMVKAGDNQRFPGTIANMYLDQMTRLVAQDEDKIQHLIDFALRAEYYDKLIAGKEDLIQQTYEAKPDYLGKPEDETQAPVPTEQPFAPADKPAKAPTPKA